MRQLIIYTCITNNKDTLKNMPKVEGVRYICFSDKPFEHSQWEYQPLQWTDSEDPRRIARWHKINSHLLFPDNVDTLWIDANTTLNFNPQLLQKNKTTNGIAAKKHPVHNCVYQEFEAVRKLKYDNLEILAAQESLYRSDDFPEKAGLSETNILYRRPCEDVIAFNTLWWNIINNYSKRDQLSFTYVLWKLGLKWDKMDVSCVNVYNHNKPTSDKQ